MGQSRNKHNVIRGLKIYGSCVLIGCLFFVGIVLVKIYHQKEDATLKAEQIKIYMENVLERETGITDIMKSWLLTLGENDMRRMQSEENNPDDQEMFREMAAQLCKDDFIRALEMQPDGVNRYVYPTDGNEAAVGIDVFRLDDTERRKDAERSRESGEKIITGPLELKAGGEALLVRNPIYYEDGTFWGFAMAVLEVPDVFEAFGLNHLEEDGYEYEVECYHGDGYQHLMAKFGEGKLSNPVREPLQVSNKKWELTIVPKGGWISVETWVWAVCGILLLSAVVAVVIETLKAYRRNATELLRKEVEAETRATVLEEEKRRLEYYDKLTGCLNLQGFKRSARWLIETRPEKQYGISYFDIKEFKVFNERFGYKEGDAVLRFIADRLQKLLGNNGIVARVSGDIFVALFYYDEAHDIEEEFAKFDRSVREYVDKNIQGFDLAIHAGIYILTREDKQKLDIQKLVDNANFAQKSIKRKSSSQATVYTGEYHSAQIRKNNITKHLTEAIKNGEISVWVQPLFNYETGQIVGAEVLSRWTHSELGFLSPAEFIPALEESGQITELDKFVWEEACRLMSKWDGLGKSISLSVNVSRSDILQENIDQYLLELVRKYKLHPSRLKLEITESAYMENSEPLLEVVVKLRKMGFIIEMDDFGTGYSSLNMLKEIPVDMLKLDMRFLSSSGDDSRGKKIISSIMQMAHATEVPVIAEGVETEAQAEHLGGIGCVLMQGYYFSKPLQVADFESLIATKDIGTLPFNFFVLDQLESELFTNNDLVPVGIIKYEANEEQKIRYVSSSLLKMLGYTRKKFIEKFGNSFPNIICEEDRERVLREIDEQTSGGEYDYCEYRIEAANGELIWVADRGHLVKDAFCNSWFYVAIVRMGQTRQKDYYRGRLLKNSNPEELSENLRQLMELMPGGVFCYDVDGSQEFVFISDGMPEMFGYTMEQFVTKFNNRFPDMVYEEDRERVLEEITSQIQYGNSDYCEYRIEMADGSLKWVYDRGRVVRDDNGDRWFYVVIMDADELKEAEAWRMAHDEQLIAELHKQAESDMLTGLLNHNASIYYIENAIREYKGGTMLVLDIDEFKQVNDQKGHLCGDRILRMVAGKMREMFCQEEILARFGGDEFVVFMPGCYEVEKAKKTAEEIIRMVRSVMPSGLNKTGCSIGVAITRKNDTTFDEIFQQADWALYQVKGTGKGKSCIVEMTEGK